jgi:hypothetical protein
VIYEARIGASRHGCLAERAFCENELLNAMAAWNGAECSLARALFFRQIPLGANGLVRGEHGDGIAVVGNSAATDKPET